MAYEYIAKPGVLGVGDLNETFGFAKQAAPAAPAAGGSWAPWLIGFQAVGNLADAAHKGKMTDWSNARDAEIERSSWARKKDKVSPLANLTSTSPTSDFMGTLLSGYESAKDMERGNSPSDWLKAAFAAKESNNEAGTKVASAEPAMAGILPEQPQPVVQQSIYGESAPRHVGHPMVGETPWGIAAKRGMPGGY